MRLVAYRRTDDSRFWGGRWLSSGASALCGCSIGTSHRSRDAPPQRDQDSDAPGTHSGNGVPVANEGERGGHLLLILERVSASPNSIAQSLSHLHSFTPSSFPPPPPPPISQFALSLSLPKSLNSGRSSFLSFDRISQTLVLLSIIISFVLQASCTVRGCSPVPARSLVPETTTLLTYPPLLIPLPRLLSSLVFRVLLLTAVAVAVLHFITALDWSGSFCPSSLPGLRPSCGLLFLSFSSLL
ncbi:hypothetical protein ASPBRDRAFT_400457 [Aspergillus brasiliensis CBS 101740]|uniref:Uncharacterized protein n=1 Tax=Aspergillus brasiliensis (strain CBS 101740 / IMI 381727 / IBT 21946) TaxID=767769 RepID=A0A1L9UWX7_ASPBC|nr:hypothetical protein ASPBRDRAFT_400457 [Aspergillus brasiliensis CBS 101740]